MRLIGALIAAILVVLFVVVLPVTIWAFNVQQALFTQATSQRLLTSDALYTDELYETSSTDLLGYLFINRIEGSNQPGESAWYVDQFFRNLPASAAPDVAGLLLPPEWIQDQFTTNLQTTFDWIDGAPLAPDLYFGMASVRDRMQGSTAADVIRIGLEALPACQPTDEVQIQTLLAETGGPDTLPACRPSDVTLADRLETAFAEAAPALPDTIPSQDQREQPLDASDEQMWFNNKVWIRVLREASFLIFLLPVVVLLLIEIMIVRSFKALFGWFGWALLLGGLVTLALPVAILFLPTAQAFILDLPLDQLQATFVLLGVLDEIARPILFQGIGVTLVGLVMVIVAGSMPRP
ncbi:MAG: hypothetical protein GYB64_19750 [Chloroflexi bacterium]|nr:hypothetical protein [Chloroflexota bacterium]